MLTGHRLVSVDLYILLYCTQAGVYASLSFLLSIALQVRPIGIISCNLFDDFLLFGLGLDLVTIITTFYLLFDYS